jgi:hypothetical protein
VTQFAAETSVKMFGIYWARALIENRNGLLLDFRVETADGRAEWRNTLAMLDGAVSSERHVTLGRRQGL